MYTPHIFSSRCTRSGLPPLLPCIPPAHPLTPFILAMDISVFLHYLPSSCGCYGTLFFIFYSHLSDMQPRTQCELTFSRNKHLLSVGENSSRALANTTAAKNRWRCIWASLTSTVGLQLQSHTTSCNWTVQCVRLPIRPNMFHACTWVSACRGSIDSNTQVAWASFSVFGNHMVKQLKDLMSVLLCYCCWGQELAHKTKAGSRQQDMLEQVPDTRWDALQHINWHQTGPWL